MVVRTVKNEQNQVAPIVALPELQWRKSSGTSSHGNYHYTIWVVSQGTHISRSLETISCWHNLSVLHRGRRPGCASGRWGTCSEPGYTQQPTIYTRFNLTSCTFLGTLPTTQYVTLPNPCIPRRHPRDTYLYILPLVRRRHVNMFLGLIGDEALATTVSPKGPSRILVKSTVCLLN